MVWCWIGLLLWVSLAVPTSTKSDAEKASAFNKWIAEHYQTPLYLEVRATPGMRFGAFATRRIVAGQIYSSTPAKLLMGRDAIQRSDRSNYLQLDISKALLLFLLHEERKGEDSFWSPFIDLLPTLEDYQIVPSFWDDAELDEVLGGTLARKSVIEGRHAEEEEFKTLKRFLMQEDPSAVAHFTRDRFKWARTVRDSRTIWLEGRDRQFVPMLDMINCKHHEDRSKVHLTRYGRTKSADTVALWSFKKGEEVFENYGQNNLMYYAYHGFSITDNVYDCYTLELPMHIMQGASSWLQQHQQQFPNTRGICVAPSKGIDRALLTVFSAYAAHVAAKPRLSDAAGLRALKNYLKTLEKAYPHTIADDQAKLRDLDSSVPYKTWAAMQYRSMELQLLKEYRALCARERKKTIEARRPQHDEL